MANNTTQGVTTNFVTLMDPLFEDFAIDEKIYRQYGDQFSAASMIVRKMGAMKPVDQVNFYHFEDNRISETLVVGANATSGGQGLPLVFTLDAVSIGPGGVSYARPWYNIIFPDNYTEGTMTSVVPSGGGTIVTITVIPKDPTVTLSVTAGQQLVVGDPNFGEGTNQPKGISPTFVRRDWNTQILKEAFENSGDAATNRAAVNISDYVNSIDTTGEMSRKIAAMGVGNSLVLAGQNIVDIRHSQQVALMIYFGQKNTNNITPIIDNDPLAMNGVVRGSEGLYRTVSDRGGVVNYATGSWSLTDYDSIADYLESQNVSALHGLMHLLGNRQFREIENGMLASNAAQFVRYDKDTANKQIFAGSSKSMNMSYVEITKGNFTFNLVQESMFQDPTAMGAVGYNTPNLGFIIPLAPGKDPKTRTNISHIGLRYKSLGAINQAYQVWNRDHTITNYDQMQLELKASLGNQFYAANQMLILEGL